MIRFTVHFRGRVQGVGFRYTTAHIARQYNVSGYVQNLTDGRVRLVAEGERDQVRGFVDQVAAEMSGYIAGQSIDESDATGEFDAPGTDRFGVRY